jgi:prophage DNA circulation protein
MSLLDKIFPASFRGVPFVTQERVLESGRKTKTHEYPGTDKRFVEDLGRLNNTYNLIGIVSDSDGSQYALKRDNLRAALDKPGLGILVHPSFGSIRVSSITYTLSERDSELGIATFSMSFEVSEEQIVPALTGNVLSTIDSFATTALNAMRDNVADNYSVSSAFPNNFLDASNKIADIGNDFLDESRKVASDADVFNNFNSQITDYLDEVNSFVGDPFNLSEQLLNLLNIGNELATNAQGTVDFFAGLFGFGDDDTSIVETTTQQAERLNNRQVLNASIAGGSLIQSYRNAVLIDYGNEIDLTTARQSLEDQYQKIINIDGFSTDYIESISDLRDQTRFYFDQQQLTVKKVLEIETNTMPATTLVYSYYGNLDFYDQIIALNPNQNASFFNGTVKILSN